MRQVSEGEHGEREKRLGPYLSALECMLFFIQ